jgi:hypothetical protein
MEGRASSPKPPRTSGTGAICRIEPNCGLRVIGAHCSQNPISVSAPIRLPTQESPMVITAPELSPLVAIIAGVLILIMPRLLNYIVALYLIFVGLVALNNIHHFIQ